MALRPQTIRNSFTYIFKCYAGEDAINQWENQLSVLITRMDIEVTARNRQFECDWKHIPLGAIDLNFLSTSGHHNVIHSPTPPQSFEPLYLHQGPMTLNHCGQTLQLNEGEMRAWAHSLP